ncbi:MAG: SdpI family protein [Chloroflexi bacterium]|nr:SdpI family protein [Chloroflexota bacterium]
MQTLLLVYIVGGLLLALISLPLIARKIKPNPYYGFRVPLTMGNPDIWYSTNKYFAKRQLAVALIEVVAAVCLYFWPSITIDAYALSVLAVFVVAFSAAFIQSWRYMKLLR